MRRPHTQTEHLKQHFLQQYRRLANIALCARATGIHRNTVYHWQEHDPAFSDAFREAEREAVETLEAEAHRRAVQGFTTTRRLFNHAGQQTGHEEVTRYSDTLLIFLLKAHRPEKYRERFDHRLSGADGAPLFPLAALRQALDDAERHG